MSFISRFFRVEKKASVPALSKDQNSFKNWTREQLVDRLLQLEQDIREKEREAATESKVTGENSTDTKSSRAKKQKKKAKEFDFTKYHTRFIALKFSYLGWNYNGLAIQKDVTPLPTVEGTILETMNKCKLVPSMIPQEYQFSRCGRTDKGVSAMNQVISLRVRSNLSPEEQLNPENDEKEIQYVNILNQLLPEDIKILSVCLRPPKGFDARFSCKSRHYKYLFDSKGLDLEMMKKAAKFYQGEHDFRNFCKLDGSKQITNYKRTIISADIMKVDGDIFCFDLVGSAFLWHQVRCMMANLFLVGQGLEEPSLISSMLDVKMIPQKPIYEMASDIPLILYDCEFEPLEWIVPTERTDKSLRTSKTVRSVALNYRLKSTVATILKENFPCTSIEGKTTINVGDGIGKVVNVYQPMLDRNVMDSFQTVNKKYKERKNRNKK